MMYGGAGGGGGGGGGVCVQQRQMSWLSRVFVCVFK